MVSDFLDYPEVTAKMGHRAKMEDKAHLDNEGLVDQKVKMAITGNLEDLESEEQMVHEDHQGHQESPD